MAAATSTASTANSAVLQRIFERRRRELNKANANPNFLPFAFDTGSFTPASTETDDINDELRVLQFPQGFHLVDFQIQSTADVDSGGTAWVYDVMLDDGTTEKTLISGCAVGQGASDEDEMDLNTGYRFVDASGYYLQLKTSTPATANAGTGALRIKGWGFMGAPANPGVRDGR